MHCRRRRNQRPIPRYCSGNTSQQGLKGKFILLGDGGAANKIPSTLTYHKSLGRDDPREVTRSQLQAAKVPIRAQKAAPPSRVSGPFLEYRRRAEKERREKGIVMNEAEHKAWIRALG